MTTLITFSCYSTCFYNYFSVVPNPLKCYITPPSPHLQPCTPFSVISFLLSPTFGSTQSSPVMYLLTRAARKDWTSWSRMPSATLLPTGSTWTGLQCACWSPSGRGRRPGSGRGCSGAELCAGPGRLDQPGDCCRLCFSLLYILRMHV